MRFFKKHLLKIVFFLVLISLTVAFFLNYIYRQEAQRSRAAIELLQMNFVPNTAQLTPGQQFTTTIRLNPQISFVALDYVFDLIYDTANITINNVQYRLGTQSGGTGNGPNIPIPTPSVGRIQIRGVFPSPDGYPIVQHNVVDVVTITFTARTTNPSIINIDYNQPHYFTRKINELTHDQVSIISDEMMVNPATIGVPTPTPTCDPRNLECGRFTPTPTCDPRNLECGRPTSTPTPVCNPNQEIPCVPSPTPTCDPRNLHCGPTLSPAPGNGSTTVNMKVRFQGITNKSSPSGSMNMRVQVKGGLLTNNVVQTVLFSPNTDGTWSGQLNFDLPVDPSLSSRYSIYLKGPKHLQKRICDTQPTEGVGGAYHCTRDGIIMSQGLNNYDFTNILLLAGDLPIGGQQNGVIDSEDTSFIRQNFGKTDPNVLIVADLNLDGSIDTQDYSLVIAALSIKYDDTVEGQ